MGGRGALLDPADVQSCRPEVHLLPPQVHKLRRPQAVPVGTRTIVASRCPQRFFRAALMSRSTSASVRYSRVRKSALGGRVGLTVRFTVGGVTSLRCRLAIRFALRA